MPPTDTGATRVRDHKEFAHMRTGSNPHENGAHENVGRARVRGQTDTLDNLIVCAGVSQVGVGTAS
jgi:hypothetical protein